VLGQRGGNRAGLSRWYPEQYRRSQGLWRGSNAGRYLICRDPYRINQ
jgi:hypothetical protein